MKPLMRCLIGLERKRKRFMASLNLVMVAQGVPMHHLSEEQFRAGSFDAKGYNQP